MWKYFYIRDKDVIHSTDKALLIRLPYRVNYAFWYSKKLIRHSKFGGYLRASIHDDMSVIAKSDLNEGEEIKLTPNDVIDMFRKPRVSIITRRPPVLEIKEVVVNADLIR